MIIWTYLIGFLIIALCLFYINKDYYVLCMVKRLKTVDGSDLDNICSVLKGRTIFGNSFDIFGMTSGNICNKQT